jgi:4-diphosphocytidyl-2-C-methyl-D-erythritol kinase
VSGLEAEAPAKLNLALAVTGRRADGYHTLRSVFVRLALHDDLAVEVAEHRLGPDSLVISGARDGVSEGDNLVLRAAGELRTVAGRSLPALCFRLTKRIPVAAGLAGGSSDAATALDLAAMAWGVRLDPAERMASALRLGADVPFFAAGHGVALVQGVGEAIQALPDLVSPAGILLLTVAPHLSTADVFAAYDRAPPAGDACDVVAALAASLHAGLDAAALAAMAPQLREANDLWAPATSLSPGLAQTRDAFEQSLGRPALLTGSGPTLFAVYPSEAAALVAADGLRRGRPAGLEGAAVIATSTI